MMADRGEVCTGSTVSALLFDVTCAYVAAGSIDSGIAELRGTPGAMEDVGRDLERRRLGNVDAAAEAGVTGSTISGLRELAKFDAFVRAEIPHRNTELKVGRADACFATLSLLVP